MKKYVTIFALLAVWGLSSTTLYGQYSAPDDWDVSDAFDSWQTDVWAYPDTGSVDDKIVWAKFDVWATTDGGTGTTFIHVKAVNTYPDSIFDSWKVDSKLIGFWMFDFAANQTATAVADESNPDWTVEDKLGANMGGTYYPGNDLTLSGGDTDYFGAFTGISDGDTLNNPPPPDTGWFTFDLGVDLGNSGDFFETWAMGADKPLLIARWQSVDGERSAKGFTIPGGIPPPPGSEVPEPSQIAFLAVLGLGGLLYTRRRLTAKK